MSKIISVHSFRGGTGKSNTTANLAGQIAMLGYRVGIIDTDIQSPGIHILFNLDESKIAHSLNDYLYGKCKVEEAAADVTGNLGVPVKGKIYLVPSSIKAGDIAKVLRENYDVGLLNDGFRDLIDALKLDALLIDTHPGLNEETLLSVAISDILVIIMRPDNQDYQGTGVTVEVARKLSVPCLWLLMNKIPSTFPIPELKARIEKLYNADVIAMLQHSDDLMALQSSSLFSLRYPDHPISKSLAQVAKRMME